MSGSRETDKINDGKSEKVENKKKKKLTNPQLKLDQDQAWMYHQDIKTIAAYTYLKEKEVIQKGSDYIPHIIVTKKSLPDFLKNLQDNMKNIPENTRFHLQVEYDTEANGGHWFLIDCYIKDKSLHTFTIDAAIVEESHLFVMDQLQKKFPNGHHFNFDRNFEKRERFMQTTLIDCQTFMLEHSRMLAKIAPAQLFEMLQGNVTASHPDYSAIHSAKIDDLNDTMSLLAPLFRSMQSYSNLKKLPESFHTTTVSKKGGQTLREWADERATKIDEKTTINQSIREKDLKYGIKINKFLSTHEKLDAFSLLRSPVGFSAMPNILLLEKNLKEQNKDTLFMALAHFVNDMKKNMPTHTETSFLFLKLDAKHKKRIDDCIHKCEKLLEKDYFEKQDIKSIIHDFILSLTNLAGHLIENESKRSLQALRVCINNAITKNPELKPTQQAHHEF